MMSRVSSARHGFGVSATSCGRKGEKGLALAAPPPGAQRPVARVAPLEGGCRVLVADPGTAPETGFREACQVIQHDDARIDVRV